MEKEKVFLKPYRIKEVSKMVGIPVGTLRQWEADLGLVIPRDEIGRYYTDFEMETFNHIKTMRGKNLSKMVIKDLLEKKNTEGSEDLVIQPSIPLLNQSEAVETLLGIKEMIGNLEQFKNDLKQEIREEIRNEVRNELVEEVKKELAVGSEKQQLLLKSGNQKIESISGTLEKMESNYKNEIMRRDEALMENMRLMREIKEEKPFGFFKKIFGK